jgi:hypothetical protein
MVSRRRPSLGAGAIGSLADTEDSDTGSTWLGFCPCKHDKVISGIMVGVQDVTRGLQDPGEGWLADTEGDLQSLVRSNLVSGLVC